MIHIIYMAAGNSRRFGSNKLFYELDGKPMYRHLLERLIEIKDRYNKLKNAESNNPVIDITVVTRYREILDYCSSIPDCHAVLSPDSEKGIAYTIKAGIMAVQEQKKTGMQDYYMFAVADQPYLKSQSVIKLIDEVLENKGNMRLVFSLRCGDAVGNPCVAELLVCDGTVVVPPSASLSKRYLLKHLQCLIVVAVADEVACCTHLWIVILCTAACIIVGIAAIETAKRSTCSK